jgi:cysteine desulfurase
MIYLDYSATTPCDQEVLEVFIQAVNNDYANPNSLHQIGIAAKDRYLAVANSIASLVRMPTGTTIFTSGATEANNLAIRGLKRPQNAHAITTEYEHSSVIACFDQLQKEAVEVEFVGTDEKGLVDLAQLESMIRPETYLISIGAVNSEIGILQNLESIKKTLAKHPQVVFHSDITQALGKTTLPNVMPDMVTFSAHKINGLKGTGALVKTETTLLKRVLQGGYSINQNRPGTPDLPQALMLEKAIDIALRNLSYRYDHVKTLNKYLLDQLCRYENIKINSNENCLPHIINVSLLPLRAAKIRDILSSNQIFVSTQTACQQDAKYSQQVFKLTGDLQRATSAIRISLSHLTNRIDLDKLIEVIEQEVLE